MIGRILKIFIIFAFFGIIIYRLFSKKQKQSLHEIIKISAWVLFAASAAVLLWYILNSY